MPFAHALFLLFLWQNYSWTLLKYNRFAFYFNEKATFSKAQLYTTITKKQENNKAEKQA